MPWATCIVFFVSGEYRHAAAPALLVGAGALLPALRERGRGAAASPSAAGARARAQRAIATALAPAVLLAAATAAAAWWPRPELAATFPSALDVRAHVRSLLTPPPGAPPPGRADYARALELLAHEGGDPWIVGDSRMWVHVRAAASLGDRGHARLALEEARTLLAADLRPGQGKPAETFLVYLVRTVPARLDTLWSLRAVRDDPDLARLALRLGADGWQRARDVLDRGDAAQAVTLLREAVAATPARPAARAELGRALCLAGRRAEGLRELREACLGWPAIPECAYYVAEQYAREGNAAQAVRAAKLALERDPAHRPSAELVRRLGDGDALSD